MIYRSSVLIISTILFLSACGTEGVATDQDADALLGAANPTTDNSQASVPDSVGNTSQAGTDQTGTNTESGGGLVATSAPAGTTAGNNTATATSPVILFTGTNLDRNQTVGNVIVLDGSASYVEDGEITSYQWSQLGTDQPLVALANANSATASFVASPEINSELLKFELAVTGSNGEVSRSNLLYSWSVEEPVIEEPSAEDTSDTESESETDASTNDESGGDTATALEGFTLSAGHFELEESGDFFAKSLNSVFVADQSQNRILHLDAQNNVEIESFQLIDKPTLIAYLEATDTLYVAFKTAGKLAKIDLDTGEVSIILIGQPALSLVTHNDRVYYTADEAPGSLIIAKALHSIGDDDELTYHGMVNGDLIEINPVSGEIYAVGTKSTTIVHRYAMDSSGMVTELQSNRNFLGNARDLSASPNGDKLAVSTASSIHNGWAISDLSTSDINITNGAWVVGLSPGTGEFSASGELFASTNLHELKVFDANRHNLLITYDLDTNICSLNDPNIEIVRFSADSKAVFARQVCGNNDEKSVLFFVESPEIPDPAPAPVIPAAEQTSKDGTMYWWQDIQSYYAQSIKSVYIADGHKNQIVHLDVDAQAVLNYFELDAKPYELAYIESTNSLYVSFAMAEKLVKINLNTGAQTEVRLDSRALSLGSNGDLVYFVTRYPVHLDILYNLNSMGSDDMPVSHGEIAGSAMKVNPLNNEFIVGSILDVNRYRLDSSGQVESLEVKSDLSGTFREFKISPDGQQLAVILFDENDIVHDLNATDLQAANGAWESSPFELMYFEFSGNGAIFAASNGDDIMLYDPISHVKNSTFDIGDFCAVGLDFNSGHFQELHFTEDDLYLVSRNDCNTQNEDRSFLIFMPVP